MRKPLTSPELQKIENRILIYIKEVCDREGIKYFLSGGTILGAVRHNGFIPWDDDIDLYMYRDDYNRFRSVMLKQSNGLYKLKYVDTDERYSLPLPKVIDTRTTLLQPHQRDTMSLGVFVDIFILDNVPEDERIRKAYLDKLTRLSKLWNAAQNNGKDDRGLKKIFRRVLWLLGPRYFAKVMDRQAQKYNSIETSLCGNMTYALNWYTAFSAKSIFGNGTLLEFEGAFYTAPEKYEDYLKKHYGDYMKFPPIEQRISKHNFVAYYND